MACETRSACRAAAATPLAAVARPSWVGSSLRTRAANASATPATGSILSRNGPAVFNVPGTHFPPSDGGPEFICPSRSQPPVVPCSFLRSKFQVPCSKWLRGSARRLRTLIIEPWIGALHMDSPVINGPNPNPDPASSPTSGPISDGPKSTQQPGGTVTRPGASIDHRVARLTGVQVLSCGAYAPLRVV